MSKISDFFSGFLGYLFGILMIYFEVFGIVHSIKHHSGGDVIASIALPPWAAYRSVEMWFHDYNSGVNWDKRLLSDSRTCIYFLSQAGGQYNQYETNKNIEEFSSKIEKYPKAKLTYLKDVSRKFIEYLKSYTSDIISGLNEYRTTQVFKVVQTQNTLRLEKELIKFNLEEDIDNAKKALSAMEEMYKSDETKATLGSNDEFKNKFDTVIKLWKDKQDSDLRILYKGIFNESP